MWVNKEPIPEEEPFLFGFGKDPQEREADFNDRFVKPIVEWVRANPGTKINVWVDGEMAPQAVCDRALAAILQKLGPEEQANIVFRNIREIPLVQSNPEAFDSYMPVYFRVDLARAIAADHTLQSESSDKEPRYFVYADLDIQPQKLPELFDRKTVEDLNQSGIVMLKPESELIEYENGFQIISGGNKSCTRSIRDRVIDSGLRQAKELRTRLEQAVREKWHIPRTIGYSMLALCDFQVIYRNYEALRPLSVKAANAPASQCEDDDLRIQLIAKHVEHLVEKGAQSKK
jgi:hypothetical protein